MGYSSYPRSTVIVLGQSSIYSLLPSTVFAQVESLLQNDRLAEAEALLERAEADLAQGSTSLGDQVGGVQHPGLFVLMRNAQTVPFRYLHQCLAFAFVRQTRFREATTHFVKGAIDPRVPVSYFDELRPALFGEPRSHDKDGITTLRGVEVDSVEVEVWDGVKEYMPDETSVDDISKSVYIFPFLPLLPAPSLLACQLPYQLPTTNRPTGNSTQLTLFLLFPCLSPLSSLPYHRHQIK